MAVCVAVPVCVGEAVIDDVFEAVLEGVCV